MEKQLSRTPFLVGEQFSIADITLYAYTHVAHEGGFDLTAYPAIRAWIKRVGRCRGMWGCWIEGASISGWRGSDFCHEREFRVERNFYASGWMRVFPDYS